MKTLQDSQGALTELYQTILDRKQRSRYCGNCPRHDDFKPLLMNVDTPRTVMLIFESPGYRGRLGIPQRTDLESQWSEGVAAGNIQQIIEASRNGVHHNWIAGGRHTLFKHLFEILAEGNVICIKNMDTYLDEGQYWQDFFVTDAALCRGKRETLGDAAIACGWYLKRQVEIANPRLVISFGREALKSLRKQFGDPLTCVPDRPNLEDITDCHGYLLQYERFSVLPLVHLSREYMTLRQSYFDYMKEGLRAYSRSFPVGSS